MSITLAAADTIAGVGGSATSITYTIAGDEVSAGADAFKVLAQGQLPAAVATIYTVPASTIAIVKSIHLVNTTAGTVTASLSVKGTAAANRLLPPISILAGGFAVFGDDGWNVYNDQGQKLGVGATGATGAAGGGVTVADEGTPLATAVTTLDFVGAGVVATGAGATKTITIAGGGSALTVKDEGSALATDATSLDFVGAGVVASGVGAAKTITIAGGSASVANPLDDVTLHGTYGDHFLAGPLNARWTRRGLLDPSETFGSGTWMRVQQYAGTNFGHLQPWTPTNETEVQMGASVFAIGDEGFGPIIVNSAGTGIWLAYRNSTRMGLFAVTTYTTATEPSSNLGYAGSAFLAEGRKVWFSIIKKGSLYYFRFSMDGATWTHELTAYAPASFTPDRIGWYSGVQDAAGLNRVFAIDWFNVVNNYGIGNNLMVTPISGTVTATANNAPSIGAVGNVIDGNTAGTGWGDATSNATIWWNAAFSVAQSMNRLRLWGYTNAWGMGYVEFSSGTKVPFFCAASQVMHLDFPTESTTFVKVWCQQQGEGTFPGFFEIEAYLAS